MMAVNHTFPVDNLIEHELEGVDCVCGPTVVFLDGGEADTWRVTHHSLDGRETVEP